MRKCDHSDMGITLTRWSDFDQKLMEKDGKGRPDSRIYCRSIDQKWILVMPLLTDRNNKNKERASFVFESLVIGHFYIQIMLLEESAVLIFCHNLRWHAILERVALTLGQKRLATSILK